MKYFAQTTRTVFLATLACAALLGCGGGGSSSGAVEPAPLVITDANMDAVAGAVIMTNSASGALAGSTDVLPGVEASSLPPSATRMLADLAVEKARTIKDRLPGQDAVVGLQYSETEPCLISGTVTVNATVSSLYELSVGDVYAFTFNNCVDVVGESINGGLRFTITSIVGDLNPYGSLGLSAEFLDARIEQAGSVLTADGAMQISMTFNMDSTVDQSIQSALFAYGAVIGGKSYQVTLKNYDFVGKEYLDPLDGRIEWQASEHLAATFPTFSGSVDVSTVETVLEHFGPLGITTGKLKVIGNASVLYITFLPDNFVSLELDSNNDGLIDVSRTVPVAELNPLFGFD